jgi:hypothetical protein
VTVNNITQVIQQNPSSLASQGTSVGLFLGAGQGSKRQRRALQAERWG